MAKSKIKWIDVEYLREYPNVCDSFCRGAAAEVLYSLYSSFRLTRTINF